MESSLESTLKSTPDEAEIAQLRATLLAQESALEQQEKRHTEVLQEKDAFIEQLKEALILARNARFASSSEAMRGLQTDLFDEAEQSTDEGTDIEEAPESDDELITIAPHQRRRGGRKPLPADLPRIDIIHDLGEEEKVCPHDGHDLKEIGTQVAEQLDIVPMKIQVLRHIRKQYACPCCDGYLKTASKPKQPIEKSQASAGLLAYIATSKYADSLPLYRQSGILKRFGIEIDRTSLCNWMIRCGALVQPLINRIEEQLLASSYLHMDETTVQVLKEEGKTAQSKSYMWVRSAGPPGARMILFDYDPSRKASVPRRLLAGYEGALMVDGYEGYSSACQRQNLTRLGCWAHARRKFVEAAKAQGKKKNTRAAYAIKLIAKLYSIEKQIAQKRPEYERTDGFDDYRYEQRQLRSKPIIEKLKAWLDQTRPLVAPKLKLGEALTYLHNQWSYLIGYLADGAYPIDNNPVENAIRPFAIGRKNWMFSTSVDGVKASANLYSLIETAKANGLEPYAYLKRVFTELPSVVDYDDVDLLLPENIKGVVC